MKVFFFPALELEQQQNLVDDLSCLPKMLVKGKHWQYFLSVRRNFLSVCILFYRSSFFSFFVNFLFPEYVGLQFPKLIHRNVTLPLFHFQRGEANLIINDYEL